MRHVETRKKVCMIQFIHSIAALTFHIELQKNKSISKPIYLLLVSYLYFVDEWMHRDPRDCKLIQLLLYR